MTIDWEDLFKGVRGHNCPPTMPKTCPYEELSCSVCWGQYIEKLMIEEHKSKTMDLTWLGIKS